MSNFIVYSLDRSRSRWMSEFLTCYDYKCGHDLAMTIRSVQDIKDYFSVTNTGTCETGTSQAWRIIKYICPEIKTLVIKRPVQEVLDSILKLDLKGVATYDPKLLEKHLIASDKCLDQISKSSGTMTVQFKDLNSEDVIKQLFEHLLEIPFNRDWYLFLKDKNIQVNVPEVLRYFEANRSEIDKCKKVLKQYMFKIRRDDPDSFIWKEAVS